MAQLAGPIPEVTEESFVALPEDEQALRNLLLRAAWAAHACADTLLYSQLRKGCLYAEPSTAWERRNARLKVSGWIGGRNAEGKIVPQPITELFQWLEARAGDDAYIGKGDR